MTSAVQAPLSRAGGTMALQQDLSIMQIDDAVAGLDRADRARFERIFHVSSTHGRLVPPDAMKPPPS